MASIALNPHWPITMGRPRPSTPFGSPPPVMLAEELAEIVTGCPCESAVATFVHCVDPLATFRHIDQMEFEVSFPVQLAL